MIKAVKRDRELLREIDETETSKSSVGIWWLGQNGFAIKFGGQVIYIDPYLSDYCQKHLARDHTRLTESPINPELIDNASIVIITHDHSDHLDPDTLSAVAKASPECVFMAPTAARGRLLELGIDAGRICPTTVGEALELNGITFHPIAAKHEEFDKDDRVGYPYQSYVIKYGRVAMYYAGDGIPYDGLADNLLPFNIDIAFLPINGHDEKRQKLGIKGNFTCEEAAQLAWQIKAKTAIPMHYDMFASNTDNVEKFTSYVDGNYPLQKYDVLKCGLKFLFEK